MRVKHDYSDGDVRFLQMMIPHHERAMKEAAKAFHSTKNEDVKEWALAIWAGQKKEVEKFKAWLAKRGLRESGGRMSGMR